METEDRLGKNMQMIKKFRNTWSGSYAIQRRYIFIWEIYIWESVYFTPADLEKLNFKYMRQHLKLRNLDLFYV